MIECKETEFEFTGNGNVFRFEVPLISLDDKIKCMPALAVTLRQKGKPNRVVHEGEYKSTYRIGDLLIVQYPLEGPILDEGDLLTVHKL